MSGEREIPAFGNAAAAFAITGPLPLWSGVILGNPQSKANSRKFVYNPRTRKPMIIKSAAARKYERDFTMQCCVKPVEPLIGDLALYVDVYYRDRRSDLDISLIADCLQRNGIIKNDRSIREIHARGFVDSKSPRAQIFVYEAGR